MENVRAGQGIQPDGARIDAYVARTRGEFEDRLGYMVEIPTVNMDRSPAAYCLVAGPKSSTSPLMRSSSTNRFLPLLCLGIMNV